MIQAPIYLDDPFANAQARFESAYPDYLEVFRNREYSERDIRRAIEAAWDDFLETNNIPQDFFQAKLQNIVLEIVAFSLYKKLYDGNDLPSKQDILPMLNIWQEIWKIITGI